MRKDTQQAGSVIEEVCSFIFRNRERKLADEVIRKAKHHILDTLAAAVSGSTFKTGQLARNYVKNQAAIQEAQVVGSPIVSSAINAAFANAMMAHADETDDSHADSLTHPGCAIVPAALSVSEREGVDGMSFLRGVVVGYDIGCRMTQALGVDHLRQNYRSTHSIGGNFGSAAAAAAILGLGETQIRYVLSYAAQQASGVTYWVRDEEHIEKAFVFGGMPARNGVTAALLMQLGFTGVWDPFTGERNFFEAFSSNAKPERLAEGLGVRHEIMFTNIKKFSVGSPIQAPLDALLLLMEKHAFTFRDVETICVHLPEHSLQTVNNRNMPDINLQYILAVALLDGDLTFEAAHSHQRMKEPAVIDLMRRVDPVADPGLSAAKNKRQGIVEVITKDGAKFREHVVSVRGTAENPMAPEEIEKKCHELFKPVLGEERAQKLMDKIWHLEQVKNVRELRPLLSVS